MKTKKEMEEEIKEYCHNMIINSNYEDWIYSAGHYYLTENNIRIRLVKTYGFTAFINNHQVYKFDRIPILIKMWLSIFSNKNENENYKLILDKNKDITNYLKNKEEYDKIKDCYKELPLKISRKEKLKNLSK